MKDVAPMSGYVVGVKEWPNPGGIREQIAAHVDAVEMLAAELNAILADDLKPKTPKPEPEPEAEPSG